MKPQTRKKLKKVFDNTLTGTKRAFRYAKEGTKEAFAETRRNVNYYGPRVNRFSKRTAENVQELFGTKGNRFDTDVDLGPTKRFDNIDVDLSTDKRLRKNKVILPKLKRRSVDWNNLGIN